MTRREQVSWVSLAAALSVVMTVIGGVQYVDYSIAEAERRAVAKAESEIAKRAIHDDRVYAKREDVTAIRTRLDQVIDLQKRILARIDRH
jgi:hypothetical protein